MDVATLFTIFWSISLLIRPISDFVGLISRHVGALLKLGLWSFSVMKASRFAMVSTLSDRPSSSAIALASLLILASCPLFAFLYDFCMFLSTRYTCLTY